MKHRIDPKIDCVFKALLGAEENSNLLIHFLNAMLGSDLPAPITRVEILNPYNDKEFLDDKLSIVDVKARDEHKNLYQIEIQLSGYAYLPSRISYTWADIYSKQLRSGKKYNRLKPTYAIWLLGENLLTQAHDYLLVYKLRDQHGHPLNDHGGIWLCELKKFHVKHVQNDQQRWLKFFRDGDQLDDALLPDWMDTPEMEQAMNTLRQFSEKERNYHAYQARLNYLRQQRTMQWELDEAVKEKEHERQEKLRAMQEKEAAMQEKEAAMQEKEAAILRENQALERENQALAEIERLKALLEHAKK